MEKIIKDSIEHFQRQRQFVPKRVVVHKSTRFSEEELTGCQQACRKIDSIDIVHIREFPGFRAYHDKYNYPVVRGTAFFDERCLAFHFGVCTCFGYLSRTSRSETHPPHLPKVRYLHRGRLFRYNGFDEA